MSSRRSCSSGTHPATRTRKPRWRPRRIECCARGSPAAQPSSTRNTTTTSPASPKLTSQLYTNDFNETKALGRKTDSARTDAQTQLALWTGENSFRWGARNLVQLAVANSLDEMSAARFFAMSFTAQSDSFQVGM